MIDRRAPPRRGSQRSTSAGLVLCVFDMKAEGWTPSVVVRKSLHSVLALGIRQVLAQALGLVGTALLARLLSPAEFGLYAVITFILSFLVAFGDAGLGASLIREAQEPAEEDYRAIFTVQQLLVLGVVFLFWLAAPSVSQVYHLSLHDAWLFRLVALSLLFTSFQVIPSIRLERELAFHKLALVEVAMAFSFYGIAVGLAWMGLGALSFALALLVRSIIGAVLANFAYPWRFAWTWQWKRVRRHLRFGLPYQGISFVSLLKDSINPIFIGLLLGAAQVGYVKWATMVAVYPVLALMALQRVYLPAFSRMQEHPDSLSRFAEEVLRATNGLVAPCAMLTLVLIDPLTRFVFGPKWLVAVPLFYLFWAANVFVATATPVMALLNALGDSRTPFTFALIWMLGTWVLGVPLIMRFGALGFALATLAIQFTNLLLYRKAQSRLRFRIFPLILPIWAWAGAVGVGSYLLKRKFPPSGLMGLSGHLAVGLVVYALGLVILYPVQARKALGWLRREGWSPAFQ